MMETLRALNRRYDRMQAPWRFLVAMAILLPPIWFHTGYGTAGMIFSAAYIALATAWRFVGGSKV
jgi:hypothetical protein